MTVFFQQLLESAPADVLVGDVSPQGAAQDKAIPEETAQEATEMQDVPNDYASIRDKDVGGEDHYYSSLQDKTMDLDTTRFWAKTDLEGDY